MRTSSQSACSQSELSRLLVLAQAAAEAGDSENAYLLFAKGHAAAVAAAPSPAAQIGNAVAAQLSDGRLTTLAQLPQQQLTAAAAHSSNGTPKRWQQLQSRLPCSAAPSPPSQNTSSSPSNTNSPQNQQQHHHCHHNHHHHNGHKQHRVFCVSDLHVDAPGGANMAWVQSISINAFQNDVLIVAGGWRRY